VNTWTDVLALGHTMYSDQPHRILRRSIAQVL